MIVVLVLVIVVAVADEIVRMMMMTMNQPFGLIMMWKNAGFVDIVIVVFVAAFALMMYLLIIMDWQLNELVVVIVDYNENR